MYYSMDGPPPVTSPILIINGENSIDSLADFTDNAKPTINNICFPSQVSSQYAPSGRCMYIHMRTFMSIYMIGLFSSLS